MIRVSLLVVFCFLLTGCGEVVPPGKKVILIHASGENEIVDTGVYYAWGRTKTYFLDQKFISKKETMKVLCSDEINLNIDIKAIIGFNTKDKSQVEFIKTKVPPIDSPEQSGKELSLDKFYQMVLSDLVRGTTRNIISINSTEAVRPNRQKLEAEIQKEFTRRVNELGYPIIVSAVLISNIDYPDSVTTTREAIKNAQLEDQRSAALAEAELAEQKRQVAVEQEKAKVRMVRAQAQADENAILTKSLTPEFLMWRNFEVMESTATALAEGQSNTVFMMPYQTMGRDMLNTTVIKNSVDNLTKVAKSPNLGTGKKINNKKFPIVK